MLSPRALLVAIIAVVAGSWAQEAAACGAWSLQTPGEPTTRVGIHWANLSLPGPRAALAPLTHDDQGRVRSVTFPKGAPPVTIDDAGALRRGERIIGRLVDDKLTISSVTHRPGVGEQTYVIEIADVPASARTPELELKPWTVTVKQNDVVILSGHAMSLWSSCTAGEAQPQHPRMQELSDIRHRVALYLSIAAR
jgi:hypothetical protein